MSMFTMPFKIAASLAISLADFGLGLIGYVAEMEVTERYVNNLLDILGYLPACCGIIMILLMA